jgi:hypothetical protein
MAMASSSKNRKKVSAKKWAEEHVSGFSRTTLAVPENCSIFAPKKAGTYRLDFIPYTAGEGNPKADSGEVHFERTYWIHRGIGPNQDSYCCPAKTFGKSCPVCEHRSKLLRKSDSDEDLIKQLTPKERQLFNIIDLSETEKGVQVWDVSYHLFGKHLKNKLDNADEDDNYDLFPDLEEGKTLKIGAQEDSMGGRPFLTFSDIEFKERKEAYDDEMFEKAHCLDEMPKEIAYEELKKLFLQEPDADEIEDDDPDIDTNHRNGKKTTAKKPVAKDEEDEEEEKPVARKGGKKEPTADEFGIEEEMLVTYEGQECEVKKISGDGTSLTLINEEGEKLTDISPADVEKLKVATEEVEEEEEPEEEEEEEEEELKPRGKAGAKKPVAKDEEEEEEEEEDLDNDEDEPAPRGSKKPAPKKPGGKR